MFRIICEIQPSIVFVENVPNLLRLGVGDVLGDLAQSGYDAKWCVLGSKDCGAVHKRDRLWILAIHPSRIRRQKMQSFFSSMDETKTKKKIRGNNARTIGLGGIEGYASPFIFGKDDEIPNRMDRFKAVGNSQDPIVAATAFNMLIK